MKNAFNFLIIKDLDVFQLQQMVKAYKDCNMLFINKLTLAHEFLMHNPGFTNHCENTLSKNPWPSGRLPLHLPYQCSSPIPEPTELKKFSVNTCALWRTSAVYGVDLCYEVS